MEKYTDQEFFYKQTPVNYDGIAKFTSIKGNTLGWNQSVRPFESAYWEGGNASTSFSNGTVLCTCTAVGGFGVYRLATNPANWQIGHVYFFSIEAKSNKAGRLRFPFNINGYDSTISETNKWVRYTYVATCPQNAPNTLVCFKLDDIEVDDTLEVRNPMKIDLTQMYGSGNEPTADEFPFSLPYYDYNQGTLIPFSGNGIKTVGKNQVLKVIEICNIDSTGKLVTDGQGYYDMAVSYVVKGQQYTFSPIHGNEIMGYFLTEPSIGSQTYDKNRITNGTSTFTAEITGYVAIRLNRPETNAQLEFGSTATTYEPYTSSTLSLPISTYFPTGMKSAGDVYDELTESKAITRIGAVDLGTLNWVYVSANASHPLGYFYSTSLVGQKANGELNMSCGIYQTIMSWSVDKSVKGNANNYTIYIVDTSYTDATAFKNSLSEVYLYYELATETETDAEDIFYKFYADGTEQLLPVNGSTPTTSYLIADIEYYDSTEGDSLYRRFWLINGDGERWDLTDKEFKSFLNNPTGLGFRKTIEVTRYGEKANKNNEVYDFPQPSGELLFYDTYNSTRYDKYNKFIRFLMSQPITLYYMIPVSYISGIANIFTLDCDVTEVQKTESKTDHILTSSIVFNGLGFYEGDEISVNGTTNTYTLTNEGDFPVGFEITIEGSLTNPYVTLSQDGELYGEAKFDSATAFNSLYLNSNDGEQNIILQQGGSVIPNPLSYQDLSISNGSIYVTFVKLAKGVSELSIGVESGSITNVNIKYSPKYRSV